MKMRVQITLFFLLLGTPGLVLMGQASVPVIKQVQLVLVFAVCALLGQWVSRHVGLSSMLLNRLAGEMHASLLSVFCFALIGGFVLGFLWVFSAWAFQPFLPNEILVHGITIWQAWFRGAVYEEVIFRWGAMSLILFLFWKAFGKSNSGLTPFVYWMSIFFSAVPFSLVHLLNVWILGQPTISSLALFVLTLNWIAGVILGWLYWKRGLECVILAHMVAQIVIFA